MDDEQQVTAIIDAVSAAPVLPSSSKLYNQLGNESPLSVRFDMVDGTAVQRAWHVRAGILWRRVKAPAALKEALIPSQP